MSPHTRACRSGKILVLFALVIVVLFGLLGLVLDGGMMMASHRQTQNAADSAALAAAMDLMRGKDTATARSTAIAWAQTYYGITLAPSDVRIPPATGPYQGNPQFVEVVASRPFSTVFAHLGGADREHTIGARAVAGFEPVSSGEGAIVLDPRAVGPGLTFNGINTRLKVKGTVVINAGGSGLNQYRLPIATELGTTQQPAVVTSNTVVWDAVKKESYVNARSVQVRGGVDTPENFRDYDDPEYGSSPLYAGMGMSPDPLRTLPVPVVFNTYASPTNTTDTGEIPAKYPVQSVSTGQTVVFNPGVYTDINITGGSATFRSGIYVISPNLNGQGLRISGGTTVSAPGGVMFYFAAGNYQSSPDSPGAQDILDGALDGPLPPNSPTTTLPEDVKTAVATLSVAGSSGSVTLDGMAYNTDNPSDRILFFGRRRSQDPNGNQTLYSVGGSGSSNMALNFKGTIYTKWASFSLGGGGSYDAQFIVGRLILGGGATMTINGTGINRGRANQVFLVQ